VSDTDLRTKRRGDVATSLVAGGYGFGLGFGDGNGYECGCDGCCIGAREVRVGGQIVELDVPGESEGAQDGDAVPVHVDLIPGQAVACGLWGGVMIVVPAFAEGVDG